jgi:HlyD family secretion protein
VQPATPACNSLQNKNLDARSRVRPVASVRLRDVAALPLASGQTTPENHKDNMKKTRVTIAVAVIAAIGAGLWFYQRADASETPLYRFATVQRANVHSTVSATGALSAVTTVQVGTQVSGQVAEIKVDFNDKVKKGQLLARIDPTLQKQAVSDAEAGVDRAKAQYEAARLDYERSKPLYEAQAITATEFNTSESNFLVSQANLKSAQVALDKARQNLAYTNIYAPIDGVVVERNVDVGQTVAASLQAPQLFLIANDLSQMQILASVDESDIGRIADGQRVSFTVQSYPGESFGGTVRQVRLQSATTENVVNYTVVVSVSNPDGKLLPGMTATATFHTDSADDVLTVPNSALRFRPSGVTAERATRERGAVASANTARSQRGAGASTRTAATTEGAAAAAGDPSATATLWHLDASGELVPLPVRTGLSDGQRTEVQGAGLASGMQVIVGSNGATSGSAGGSSVSNPLQSQQGGRPRPPGVF